MPQLSELSEKETPAPCDNNNDIGKKDQELDPENEVSVIRLP